VFPFHLILINKLLLFGQTDNDKKYLASVGGIPIGIGRNVHIKRAIIDKNARIGDDVKVSNFSFLLFNLIKKNSFCLFRKSYVVSPNYDIKLL
jgi:ADP-glucose pyrophosphorylase